MLTDLDTDLPKFIYLLSDEYHDSGPGRSSRNETQTIIIEKARDQKVVINAIKYSRVKYGEHRLPELAKQTFGQRKQLDPSNGLELLNEGKKNQIKSFIKNTLNWRPKHKLSISLEKTFQWYIDNQEWSKEIILKNLN